MTPAEFVVSIPGFSNLKPVEQIKRFCWYLAFHNKKATFAPADVSRCYDLSKCSKPSSVGPFFTSLADRKPAYLLRRSGSYELSQLGHDEFDAPLGQRAMTIAVHQLLLDLPAKLTVPVQKAFLDEALVCFKHGAMRAAIVMTWNLAFDHLCHWMMLHHLAAFNIQLPKTYSKADVKVINVRDDFEALKEFQVLQVAASANIISGTVHKILKEKLDRRNIAAHPSSVVILPHTTEEFILDLVENVVLKLK